MAPPSRQLTRDANQQRFLHEIVGFAIDSIYAANIGLPSDLKPGDLTAKTIELLLRLEDWRQGLNPFDILKSSSELSSWSSSNFHTDRYILMLTIFYHKAVMIISWPVLVTVLDRTVNRQGANVGDTSILQSTFLSVIKQDLKALREFQVLMEWTLQRDPGFFKRNAVWWVCNFTGMYRLQNTLGRSC